MTGVSDAEIGCLDGVTSNIQAQLETTKRSDSFFRGFINPTNGTIFITDILYAATEFWTLDLVGNSYTGSSCVPIYSSFQGYLYQGNILAPGGFAIGNYPKSIIVGSWGIAEKLAFLFLKIPQPHITFR